MAEAGGGESAPLGPMAASGAGARQARRGPAPIASFDHDGADDPRPAVSISAPSAGEARPSLTGPRPQSSPESKQPAPRLPEIREDAAGGGLAAPAARARSHSTPACGALGAPAAPRIDISRASSSSHHDSRDSSPEMALFAGAADTSRLELGFREDGALDLRSSTEELAFLEPAPGEAAPAPRPPPPPPAERRHSRKDSQSSEAALLAVSGRTSRLSSVGSQCSAASALSRVSRLSVASGASRSPSPHRMLLETSFCGPKPIEADPEISAGALVDRILGVTRPPAEPPAPAPATAAPAVDARDRREVRTEVTVESAPPPPPRPDDRKGRGRPRVRRQPSEPEVYKSGNRARDIIRIRLKPDDSCDEEEERSPAEAERPPAAEPAAAARVKPATLELGPAGPAPAPPSPAPSRRRSPSPAAASVSRKSSFCSLFKSRETVASPESPSEALRRKRSLTDGRSRSKSRDRSATPTSACKLRGSVLSLFRSGRRGAPSPAPRSRDGSPAVRAPAAPAPPDSTLKYYAAAADGIIHIPLRTPPDEAPRRSSGGDAPPAPAPPREPRPASAPSRAAPKPIARTVLPDGSIIIPLRSPTDRSPDSRIPDLDRPLEEAEATATADRAAVDEPVESAVDGSAAAGEPVARAPSPVRELPAAEASAEAAPDDGRRRRKERLTFTTHVGSREQVFSTQFSITKTPSVASEISGSFPSFGESEETRAAPAPGPLPGDADGGAPDSSESEASSEAAPATPASDVERRGLVVQESFEEELPYVPTTLPQERPVALPMVPVRDRGGVRVSGTRRPRAAPDARAPVSAPVAAPAPAPAPPTPADKLRIKLPRRPRATPGPAPGAPSGRPRGSHAGEPQPKADWIDFEEVEERRKQPRRIQTLPASAVGGGGVVFSYVEPERCRCECHGREPPSLLSSSSAELDEEAP